jgi:predicted nucleic acid-binding protein
VTVVLDAGVFIAGARGNRATLASLSRVAGKAMLVVPATAIAEFWRDGSRSAREARLFNAWQPNVVSIEAELARRAGAYIGVTKGADTLDAIVVAVAASVSADQIFTTDPDDIEALVAADPRTSQIAVVKVD